MEKRSLSSLPFCDGVTTQVDKGKATDEIYLASIAFDTVLHSILLFRLEGDEFDEWNVRWIRN